MMRCTTYYSEDYYIGFGNIVKIVVHSDSLQFLIIRKVWETECEVFHFDCDNDLEEYLDILTQGRRF